MNWFKGNLNCWKDSYFMGRPWFPVDFPLNLSIEQKSRNGFIQNSTTNGISTRRLIVTAVCMDDNEACAV
jgi:hypothetical protein